VGEKVPTERLRVPLSRKVLPNDPQVESYVLELICDKVKEARGDVVVLVDACAIRHHTRDELREFLEATGFPVYAAPMGKTLIDEGYERYGGIYVGSLTGAAIKSKVESAALILSVGALKGDFNTGNFTYNIPPVHTIELHSTHTQVQFAQFAGIGMKQLLPKLTEKLRNYKQEAVKIAVPRFKCEVPQAHGTDITHAWFWPRFGSFFKENDVIVTETGTSNFGILDIPLPKGSKLLNQILWGSIGWATGSTLGAAIAARECNLGRTILFIGDGSIQLTVQELATMIRTGLNPIIFLLNNDGYTIERFIHGKERKYNDISNWDWTGLLKPLGDPDGKRTRSYRVKTPDELSRVLEDKEFQKAEKMQLVEVIMNKFDGPRLLVEQSELTAKLNHYGTNTAE